MKNSRSGKEGAKKGNVQARKKGQYNELRKKIVQASSGKNKSIKQTFKQRRLSGTSLLPGSLQGKGGPALIQASK